MLRPRAALVALAACVASPVGGSPDRAARVDASLSRAAAYLVRHQSRDGAWRSGTYGIMRDGTALTPLILSGLHFLPQGGPAAKNAYRRSVAYFRSFVRPDGTLKEPADGFTFPVLSAASASRVVALYDKTEANRRAQRAWLDYMRTRQLTERLGWSPDDPEYGGWGFSLVVPRKPGPGGAKGMLVESNMVATIFGVAALRSARVAADDPAYGAVLTFVRRCQNHEEDPARHDSRYDDGGFYFTPGDPLQNKAGVAGRDIWGRERYRSYGTMTADGLRALIRCGLPHDHPRVVASRRWLEANFSVKHNPGRFTGDRRVLQDATYYYWCWAVAHAFAGLGLKQIEGASGKSDWASALSDEILRRQRSDGSWVNRYTDAKEDDPLLATAWASAALAICRESMTGVRWTLSGREPSGRPTR